jgi:hypothetical protein
MAISKYEEFLIQEVVSGRLDKISVLNQMVESGTIKTADDYDMMARHIAYRIIMAREWNLPREWHLAGEGSVRILYGISY